MNKKNEKTIAKIASLLIFLLGLLEYYLVTNPINVSWSSQGIPIVAGLLTAIGFVSLVLMYVGGK